jgi:hypothetical protein
METKNTNLNQQSDSSKKQQKDKTQPNKNDNSRIFNTGEFNESQNKENSQQTTGKDKQDSTIPNEIERQEWNENEKARDDQKMYVKEDDNDDLPRRDLEYFSRQ